jgi:hypothetical protein
MFAPGTFQMETGSAVHSTMMFIQLYLLQMWDERLSIGSFSLHVMAHYHITCCRCPSFFSKHSTFTQPNLQAALQIHGMTYPPVDLELMQRYLIYLTSVNLIPHPIKLLQNGEFASYFVWYFTLYSIEAWMKRWKIYVELCEIWGTFLYPEERGSMCFCNSGFLQKQPCICRDKFLYLLY